MRKYMSVRGSTLEGLVCIIALTFCVPIIAAAVSGEGNAICFEPGMCPYGQKCPPPNGPPGVIGKPCQEQASGKVCQGSCIAPFVCKASGCEGLGGKGEAPKLPEIKPPEKKPKEQQPPPQNQEQKYPACQINEATKTVAPIPCTCPLNGQTNYTGDKETCGMAQSTSELLNYDSGEDAADTLLDSLIGNLGNSDDSDAGADAGGEDTAATEGEGTTPPAAGPTVPGNSLFLKPNVAGDVYIGESGVTLVARSRDPETNAEVSGFFGGSASSLASSESILGRMCANRPWASNLFSLIIPPTFFDGLCQRVGYRVGGIATDPASGARGSAPKPVIRVSSPKSAPPTVAPPPAAAPEVDIWAEPANVRLGTRTYIFWNTRNVESCTLEGPSFSHTSLSGGASTVPLSDESTFNITCEREGGEPVSDSVTVRLAI